jgi:glycosyltransferase involved in cell wall biosynthesis
MKLCVVTHSLIKGDGQGRVNYEVVAEALRQGHQVTILASQLDIELAQNPLLDWVYIPVKTFPTELIRNLAFSWQSARWLKKNRSKFDIVKINGAITSASAELNAVHFVHSSWLKSPVHTWQQRKDLYGLYQWLYTSLNAFWERQAFARAKAIIAVSQKVKQELLDIGVSGDRIEVITNGVDLEEFAPGASDRSNLGLPNDVVLALFAGDIRTPRKNLDTVLQAVSQVSNLHLAVAGDTKDSPYPQLAEKLGISNRVHFLGYRRDMSNLMKAVDLFIFPSRYEACSLVLLEAMASGIPVITAQTSGGAELVSPECGFILSDPDDLTALTGVLEQLTKAPQLRQKMGLQARQTAEQNGWTQMANKYLELFRKYQKVTSNNHHNR